MSRNSMIATALGAVILISVSSVADAKRARPSPLPSAVECDAYARNYAYDLSRQGQILGGTAFGSLGGFALGSIWAASGVGAAIGAGIGLIGGLIARSTEAEQMYRVTYQECMAGHIQR